MAAASTTASRTGGAGAAGGTAGAGVGPKVGEAGAIAPGSGAGGGGAGPSGATAGIASSGGGAVDSLDVAESEAPERLGGGASASASPRGRRSSYKVHSTNDSRASAVMPSNGLAGSW